MNHYLNKAANFAAEAAKFSLRVGEELVEKSKEVSISGYSYDRPDDHDEDIKVLLNSTFMKEKLEGLKRLIAVCIIL